MKKKRKRKSNYEKSAEAMKGVFDAVQEICKTHKITMIEKVNKK